MDTLFSDFTLTANRLAALLLVAPDEQSMKLEGWHRDDQRSNKRRQPYGLTRQAVEQLHKGLASVGDIRLRVDEWRLDNEAATKASERTRLANNIRATSQYLDEHGERKILLLSPQQFQPVVDGVRLRVRPHMTADVGGRVQQLWLDCSQALDEPLLIAKCYVTLWAAQRMDYRIDQCEVVHSAMKRIVARATLPVAVATQLGEICARVHRGMARLQSAPDPRR